MPGQHSNRFRYWIFVENFKNNTLDEFIQVGLIDFSEFVNVRYAIYSIEIGDDGTTHFQGYIQFIEGQSLKQLKKFNPRAHWQRASGDAESNIDYVHKRGKHADKAHTTLDGPFVYGTPITGQGNRSELDAIHEDLDKGATMEDISSNYFGSWVRYHKSFEEYRRMKFPDTDKTDYSLDDYSHERLSLEKSVYLIGPTGIGKTNFALAHFTNPLKVDTLDSLRNLTPKHDGIVFDDIDLSSIPASTVIHLTDTSMNQKIHCRYDNVTIPRNLPRIFTSNHVSSLFPRNCSQEHHKAITRRVTLVEVETLFIDFT